MAAGLESEAAGVLGGPFAGGPPVFSPAEGSEASPSREQIESLRRLKP